MTTTNENTPTPDPIARAIAALTAAARADAGTIGHGTANGHGEPAGFAGIACHVITSVAANIGGIETLLAGRPGSWEADHVRGIVQRTAGDALARYRTEPVRLAVDFEGTFGDFGLCELYARDRERAMGLERAGGPAGGQAAKAGAIVDAIDRLWEQDLAAYRDAYMAAARQALARRGLTIEVEQADQVADPLTWDRLTAELHEHARAFAPLPMTGEAPDWTGGTPADALRRTGLTYIARAREAV